MNVLFHTTKQECVITSTIKVGKSKKMKTSDFCKAIYDLGFRSSEGETDEIVVCGDFNCFARVSNKTEFEFSTTKALKSLSFKERKTLIDTLIKYSSTPIIYRKSDLFRIVTKDSDDIYCHELRQNKHDKDLFITVPEYKADDSDWNEIFSDKESLPLWINEAIRSGSFKIEKVSEEEIEREVETLTSTDVIFEVDNDE